MFLWFPRAEAGIVSSLCTHVHTSAPAPLSLGLGAQFAFCVLPKSFLFAPSVNGLQKISFTLKGKCFVLWCVGYMGTLKGGTQCCLVWSMPRFKAAF